MPRLALPAVLFLLTATVVSADEVSDRQKAVAVDGEVVTDGQRVLARGAVHVVRCGRQYRKVTLG